VLIVERLWHPNVLAGVQYANSRGVMTVFDVDDDYWALDPNNPAHAFWNDEHLGQLAQVIKAASLVTTSTAPLAERMRRINPNVRVLPNMLPDEHWPTEAKNVRHGDPVVVGWAGSPSHYSDLTEFTAILPQILDTYPNVVVHLAGTEKERFPEHDRLKFLDPVKIEQYPEILQTFDIGLAPVKDVRFNEAKSDLKVLEYGMVGLPVIASKVIAYSDSVRPGETGYLAKSPKDWLKYLKLLIEDGELRARLGAAGRSWAETRLMSRNVERWERTYRLLG
jgi:glycosyltransferase involved in cell wall biosynthesis